MRLNNKTLEISDSINDDGCYIILPCVHSPFHNGKFINTMLKLSPKDGVIHLGDLLKTIQSGSF